MTRPMSRILTVIFLSLTSVNVGQADESAKKALGAASSLLNDYVAERLALVKPSSMELKEVVRQTHDGTANRREYVENISDPVHANRLYHLIKLGPDGEAVVGYEEAYLVGISFTTNKDKEIESKMSSVVMDLGEIVWPLSGENGVRQDLRTKRPLIVLFVYAENGLRPQEVKFDGQLTKGLDPALVAGAKALAKIAGGQALAVSSQNAENEKETTEVQVNGSKPIDTLYVFAFEPNQALPEFGSATIQTSVLAVQSNEFDKLAVRISNLEKVNEARLTRLLDSHSDPDSLPEDQPGNFSARMLARDHNERLTKELATRLKDHSAVASGSSGPLDIVSLSRFSFSLAYSIRSLKQLEYNAEQNTVVTKEDSDPLFVTANLHPFGTYHTDNGFGLRDLVPHLMVGVRVPVDQFEPMVGLGSGIKFKRFGIYAWGGYTRQEEATAGGGSDSDWKSLYGVSVRIPVD